jgi:hypothetical protein
MGKLGFLIMVVLLASFMLFPIFAGEANIPGLSPTELEKFADSILEYWANSIWRILKQFLPSFAYARSS